jgi:hypothetical protein
LLSRRARAAKKACDAVSSDCANIVGNNVDYDVKQSALLGNISRPALKT